VQEMDVSDESFPLRQMMVAVVGWVKKGLDEKEKNEKNEKEANRERK
jgi:hypothetical protein